MKNIIIIIIIFIVGFVSAKYIYQSNDSLRAPIEEAQEAESDYPNADKTKKPALNKDNDQADNSEAKKNKFKKISNNNNNDDSFVPDQKIKDIEKKLRALDKKIENDLNAIGNINPKSAEEIKKAINEKPKGLLPGEDKFTEKEYE